MNKTKASKGKGKEKETRENSVEIMDVDNVEETDYAHETLPSDLKLRKHNPHGRVPVKRKADERERNRMERLEKELTDVRESFFVDMVVHTNFYIRQKSRGTTSLNNLKNYFTHEILN